MDREEDLRALRLGGPGAWTAMAEPAPSLCPSCPPLSVPPSVPTPCPHRFPSLLLPAARPGHSTHLLCAPQFSCPLRSGLPHPRHSLSSTLRPPLACGVGLPPRPTCQHLPFVSFAHSSLPLPMLPLSSSFPTGCPWRRWDVHHRSPWPPCKSLLFGGHGGVGELVERAWRGARGGRGLAVSLGVSTTCHPRSALLASELLLMLKKVASLNIPRPQPREGWEAGL